MKKEGKDMFFFLRSSSPPAAQGLFTKVAPARRVWGYGGHAYLEKYILTSAIFFFFSAFAQSTCYDIKSKYPRLYQEALCQQIFLSAFNVRFRH